MSNSAVGYHGFSLSLPEDFEPFEVYAERMPTDKRLPNAAWQVANFFDKWEIGVHTYEIVVFGRTDRAISVAVTYFNGMGITFVRMDGNARFAFMRDLTYAVHMHPPWEVFARNVWPIADRYDGRVYWRLPKYALSGAIYLIPGTIHEVFIVTEIVDTSHEAQLDCDLLRIAGSVSTDARHGGTR